MTINNQQGMKIIALGTGGGPIVSSSRAGISTAICVDNATYIVDCGMGSIRVIIEVMQLGANYEVSLSHIIILIIFMI